MKHPKENWKEVYKNWLLNKIQNVKTKTGETVSADESTFNHILENKDGEAVWRFRTMPLVLQTLKEAEEVWQGYRGNNVHIAMINVNNVPHFVVAVTNKGKLVSFYSEKRNLQKMEKYRSGKLLYKEKESK